MRYVDRDVAGNIVASYAQEQFRGQETVGDTVIAALDSTDAKTAQLINVRALREVVLGRLDGIAGRATRAGDTTGIAAACDAAVVALLDITASPAVASATDGPSARAALISEWDKISAALATAAPSAAKAFSGLSLA